MVTSSLAIKALARVVSLLFLAKMVVCVLFLIKVMSYVSVFFSLMVDLPKVAMVHLGTVDPAGMLMEQTVNEVYTQQCFLYIPLSSLNRSPGVSFFLEVFQRVSF